MMQKNKYTIILLTLINIAVIILSACSDDSTNNNADSGTDGDSDADAGDIIDTDSSFDGVSGDFLWAASASGRKDSFSRDLTVLNDDTIAFTGFFTGAIMLNDKIVMNAADSGDRVLLNSNGLDDCYVAKYTPKGAVLWAKSFGGKASENTSWIVAGAEGGIVTILDHIEGITIDGSYKVKSEDSELQQTTIIGFSTDGDILWTTSMFGSKHILTCDIAAAADGSFTVIGAYIKDITLAKGTENEVTLVTANDFSSGGSEPYMAKFSADGTLEWAKGLPNIHLGFIDNQSRAKIRLTENAIGIAGSMQTSIFGFGQENETEIESSGLVDMFAAKYTTDGDFVWVKSMGMKHDKPGVLSDQKLMQRPYGFDIASDGSFYLTGHLLQHVTFGVGEPNETLVGGMDQNTGYIAKLSGEDGTLHWVKTIHDKDSFNSPFIWVVKTLPDNSVLIGGSTPTMMIFGEGSENETITDEESVFRSFIAHYDKGGEFQWLNLQSAVYPATSSGTATNFDLGIIEDRIFSTGFISEDPNGSESDLDFHFGEGLPTETILKSEGGSDSLFTCSML